MPHVHHVKDILILVTFIDLNQKLHQNLNQTHMNFDTFKRVIENNLKNFYNKSASYEGELGDPLVHPKIKSFINYGCKIFRKLIGTKME